MINIPSVKKFKVTHIPPLLIVVFAMISFVVGVAKTPDKNQMQDVRKADYIFLEALRHKALNQHDAYYDLISAAYQLNPSDKYIAKELGQMLLNRNGLDSAAIKESLAMMAPYVEENPDDLMSGVVYTMALSKMGNNEEALRIGKLLYDNCSDPSIAGPFYASMLAHTGDTAKVKKAIKVLYETENSEGGGNLNTVIRRMQYHMMIGDTVAVIGEGKGLLKSNPSSIEYMTLLGDLYSQINRPDSALAMYNQAVQTDPSSGMAYFARANYYNQIGDSVAYDREVFQALMLPDLDYEPKLGILHRYVVNLYADSTQHSRIEELFMKLVDQYPHEKDLRFLFGDYLIIVDKYAPAAEQIGYGLDANPDDEPRWKQLGVLYYNLQQYGKGLQIVEDALKYFPQSIDMFSLGATLATNDKDYVTAFTYLHKAIAVADTTDIEIMSELYGAVGDTYYASNKVDSAFVYYEKALATNPGNLLAMNNCAYHLACEEKDLDRALTLIKKVVDAKPDDATTLDTYAWVLFKRKEYDKAKEAIDATLEADEEESSSAEVLEHAGDIYFMNGLPDEALDFWKQALELNPDNELLNRKVKNKTFFFK